MDPGLVKSLLLAKVLVADGMRTLSPQALAEVKALGEALGR